MKAKRKRQKERDRQIKMVNQIAKLFLNSAYGKMVTENQLEYFDTDSAIYADFNKKQEV